MRRWGILGGVLAAIVVFQLLPVERSNPPVESEPPASPGVRSLLRRACYNCHSNETRWPWYSRVAPSSWIISMEVEEARSRLNFSHWTRYDTGEQIRLRQQCWEKVELGTMPPWSYLLLNPEGELSALEKEQLKEWSLSDPQPHP